MSNKPQKPDDSECCGSGCNPCIFDIYEENLKKWETKRENFTNSKALNQTKYLPFLIIEVKHVTELVKVFRFQSVTLKRENRTGVLIKNTKIGIDCEIIQEFLNIKPGQYLIMKGAYESTTISRSYTPVLSKEDFEKGLFKAIISLQAKGKMSQFLTTLNTNDIIFWRGPYQEFTYHPNSYRTILLFGGGTGVVPLYNISKGIVENDQDETWVKAVFSFKSVQNLLLRKELNELTDYWNFKINVYISSENDCDFKPNYNESVVFKRVDDTVIREEVQKCGDDFFVIVSGPEKFNQFVKENLLKLGVKTENIFIFWYSCFLVFLLHQSLCSSLLAFYFGGVSSLPWWVSVILGTDF